jgi:mannose-6-phosphate isomerase-like protein (cupin superfamily)
MTVDGKEVVAGPGDVVVIGAGAPHRFTAIGDQRLVAVCIHASDRFAIELLGD